MIILSSLRFPKLLIFLSLITPSLSALLLTITGTSWLVEMTEDIAVITSSFNATTTSSSSSSSFVFVCWSTVSVSSEEMKVAIVEDNGAVDTLGAVAAIETVKAVVAVEAEAVETVKAVGAVETVETVEAAGAVEAVETVKAVGAVEAVGIVPFSTLITDSEFVIIIMIKTIKMLMIAVTFKNNRDDNNNNSYYY